MIFFSWTALHRKPGLPSPQTLLCLNLLPGRKSFEFKKVLKEMKVFFFLMEDVSDLPKGGVLSGRRM